MTTPNSTDHGAEPLLSVRNLTVEFEMKRDTVRAVSDVTFDVNEGEVVGLVGESGSGKTVTIMSLLGLIPSPPGRIVAGSATFRGTDLIDLAAKDLRHIRGKEIAMIFQDPMTSLNPVMKVGAQIIEGLRTHDRDLSRREARAKTIELLASVGIPQAEERVDEYPHAFSGGMRQRVVIAMAIANSPDLLLADEPTTALDVTTQAQVLKTLQDARDLTDAAMILVTHDLGLVADAADRILVMYAGRVVEEGTGQEVFETPRHPYTAGLLASLPSLDERMDQLPVVPGTTADPANQPTGCGFHPRCEYSLDAERCASEVPELTATAEGRVVRCHFADELIGRLGQSGEEQQ